MAVESPHTGDDVKSPADSMAVEAQIYVADLDASRDFYRAECERR